MPAPEDPHLAPALELLDRSDTYAVIEFLAEQDPVVAAKAYGALQRELYWKRKAVAPMIALSRAGIQHGMVGAKQTTDPDISYALLDSAKQIAYNLASFTWPGWDEEGITLSASDVAVGLDAACVNLRLANMLDRPAKGKANAHWAIGAMLLCTGDYDGALSSFASARDFAILAADPSAVKMHEGYSSLTGHLANRDDPEARAAFDTVIAALQAEDSDDSREYARQLTVAARVL